MSKLIAYTFTALLIATSSQAIARQMEPQSPRAEAGTSDLTDLRIDVVRSALNLTPEQARYWPAIETAIRERAEGRRQRIEDLQAAMDSPRTDRNFVKAMQKRAENLSDRADALKNLATAWEPLYAMLDDAQKQRMRVLAALVLHRVGEGLEARRDEMDDDDMWGPPVVSGMGMSMPMGGYAR